ncbi:choice-of-anchor P family protein [Sinosporangium siamense]|uniref:choice-of-anchor P family protein n=1 Tax=Sinosporangium siamense TaxID=1367973 RepID=UPI00195112A1|nr:choice-of-anchor P family protein [Sinosporangium siamense]
MSIKRGLAVAAMTGLSLLTAVTSSEAAKNNTTLHAYGISVGGSPGTPLANVNNPHASVASVNIPPVTTGVVTVSVTQTPAAGTESATAQTAGFGATVAGIALAIGAAEATCNASAAGNTGSTTLANVNIPGISVGSNPAANTTFNIPAGLPVLTVVFNQQIPNANGSLTVNAVHITTIVPGTDIIVSQAQCGPPDASPVIPLASGAGLYLGLGLAAAAGYGLVRMRRRNVGTAAI